LGLLPCRLKRQDQLHIALQDPMVVGEVVVGLGGKGNSKPVVESELG